MIEKYDSIRRGGREILKLMAVISGEELLSDPIRQFYTDLASKAILGAKNLFLSYENELFSGLESSPFSFRSLTYLFRAEAFCDGEEINIKTQVFLARGSDTLWEKTRFQRTWKGSELLLPSKAPKERKSKKENH